MGHKTHGLGHISIFVCVWVIIPFQIRHIFKSAKKQDEYNLAFHLVVMGLTEHLKRIAFAHGCSI